MLQINDYRIKLVALLDEDFLPSVYDVMSTYIQLCFTATYVLFTFSLARAIRLFFLCVHTGDISLKVRRLSLSTVDLRFFEIVLLCTFLLPLYLFVFLVFRMFGCLKNLVLSTVLRM